MISNACGRGQGVRAEVWHVPVALTQIVLERRPTSLRRAAQMALLRLQTNVPNSVDQYKDFQLMAKAEVLQG